MTFTQADIESNNRKLMLKQLGKSTIAKAERIARLGHVTHDQMTADTFIVKGSKNNFYSVSKTENSFFCSCTGWTVKKNACGIGMCKHSLAVEIFTQLQRVK